MKNVTFKKILHIFVQIWVTHLNQPKFMDSFISATSLYLTLGPILENDVRLSLGKLSYG